MEGAARVFEEKAVLGRRFAQLAFAIAKGMRATDRRGVTVSPGMRQRMEADPGSLTLAQLRVIVDELEEASLSMFDPEPNE